MPRIYEIDLKPHLNTVIRAFEKAAQDMIMLGTIPLDERPAVKKEYKRAMNLLRKHLATCDGNK